MYLEPAYCVGTKLVVGTGLNSLMVEAVETVETVSWELDER